MYISKFEIRNYKSYREPIGLEFKPGFNIITGQNSAGKTSLLEALTLGFSGTPHRSVKTVPERGAQPPTASRARATFVFGRDEFVSLLGGSERYLPMPLGHYRPGLKAPFSGSQGEIVSFLNWLLSQPEFHVSICLERALNSAEYWSVENSGLGVYEAEPALSNGAQNFASFTFVAGRILHPGTARRNPSDDFSILIAQSLRHRIYRFSAERFNIGQCPFGNNTVLASNAGNLPEVLNVLQHNTQRLLRFNELLREVLPQVRQVTVRPLNATHLEATVWPFDLEREDLAIPLNQCGSGVGQVLAILYVVMTSHQPQTIIVDEPQSFLHPGAVRKLVEILKMHPQHQYILATHSPTVIASCDPVTLTMARLSEGESVLQSMSSGDARDLQLYLGEIGARLSDVFGADNILWVEGPTEEMCIPLVINKILKLQLMGTAVLGIRRTGDLESRDAKRILEIYRRISTSNALLPPALCFLIDSECRSESEQNDLKRLGGILQFLPRRMYENFLLNPFAIAAVANNSEGFRGEPIRHTEVAELISRKAQEMRYFCPGLAKRPADWADKIDAAKVLKEIFNELSETRVAYDKVTHGLALTEWLVENAPGELKDLSDVLTALLKSSATGIATHA